jgi:ribosomal protein L11
MLNDLLDVKHIKKIYIMSNKAESAPPLSTILGNIGVNTIKFCDEFNQFTKDLPNYFILKVVIYIYDNRTFKFFIKGPSTGFLLNLLKFERKIKVRVFDRFNEKTIICIYLKDIIQIALFKFPGENLNKSLLVI